jgi:hypothetical protein
MRVLMDGMKLMESVMLVLMGIVISMVMVVTMKGVRIQGGESCCYLPLYLSRGSSA